VSQALPNGLAMGLAILSSDQNPSYSSAGCIDPLHFLSSIVYLSPMTRYFPLAILLLLSACFLQKGARKSKPDTFRYGTSRDAVVNSITDRNEIMVAEFRVPEGHLVAYQYSLFGREGLKAPRYYLYFMNDTLIRKSEPEELVQGARTAVREYYRSKPSLQR